MSDTKNEDLSLNEIKARIGKLRRSIENITEDDEAFEYKNKARAELAILEELQDLAQSRKT